MTASKEAGTDEWYYKELSPEQFVVLIAEQFSMLDEGIETLQSRKKELENLVNRANWGWDMGMRVIIYETNAGIGIDVMEKPPMGFGV